jgi:hypothetical protein
VTPDEYYERETFTEWFFREHDSHENEKGRIPPRVNLELAYAQLQHEEMCRDWFPQDRGFWDESIEFTRRHMEFLEIQAR